MYGEVNKTPKRYVPFSRNVKNLDKRGNYLTILPPASTFARCLSLRRRSLSPFMIGGESITLSGVATLSTTLSSISRLAVHKIGCLIPPLLLLLLNISSLLALFVLLVLRFPRSLAWRDHCVMWLSIYLNIAHGLLPFTLLLCGFLAGWVYTGESLCLFLPAAAASTLNVSIEHSLLFRHLRSIALAVDVTWILVTLRLDSWICIVRHAVHIFTILRGRERTRAARFLGGIIWLWGLEALQQRNYEPLFIDSRKCVKLINKIYSNSPIVYYVHRLFYACM